MKRRTFLQSVLGVLVAPCLPRPKAEFKLVSSYKGKAPMEFGNKCGWKMWQANRIINEALVQIITCHT